MPEFSPMTDLVEVVHAWSEANANRFEQDGVAAEIPPVSTFSTGEATRFVLKRGAIKLQVFAWDTGDFVLHTEDAAHSERKATLALKIKSGDEAVPIIEERYRKIFGDDRVRRPTISAANVAAPYIETPPAKPEEPVQIEERNLESQPIAENTAPPAQQTDQPTSPFERATEKGPPRNFCLVCGYDGLHAAPIDENGIVNHQICPCCGYQFGYDDQQRGITYEAARKRWIGAGMPWFSQTVNKPKFWDASVQLKRMLAR